MLTILQLAFALALLLFPAQSARAAREGLTLCLETVIPSLFPFFVLSSLLISCGMAEEAAWFLSPLMRPLFHLSGSCGSALVLGLVGGYPVGARTARALYERGTISKSEAGQLLCFTNNAGPGFILGICGASVFSSARIGGYLYLVHAAAALLTGVLLRPKLTRQSGSIRRQSAEAQPFSAVFPAAVQSSFSGVLNVSAFVVLFMVLLRLMAQLLPFPGTLPCALLLGFVELTNGVTALSADRAGFIACAALLSWGSLSVHCQTLAVLSGSGLDSRLYLRGKIMQAVLSVPLAWLISFRLF